MQVAKSLFFNKPIVLSLAAGLLLYSAWPMSPFTFLIFFAFIPLVHLSHLPLSNAKYFGCLYFAMLLWNVSTTWWIWYASPPGAIAAFIANSLLMCIPWFLYRMVKKRLPTFLSYTALICFWMMWEYTHLQDWGLSWPWLTVGNVFATSTNFIQWYEYTGVAGGTLLVFIINILCYTFFKYFKVKKLKQNKWSVLGASIALLSILYIYSLSLLPFSEAFYRKYTNKTSKANCVIVQPNINPYTEKMVDNSFTAQLKALINTSRQQVDSNTTLLLWPETALYNEYRFDENNINSNHSLDSLFAFLQQYPKLQLFTGIESYKTFAASTAYSRMYPNTNFHYESYNSSVLLTKDGAKQFYHKSMLVPGVETLPPFLNFMGKWFEDFGGTTNGYVKQTNRTPIMANNELRLAPAICYESIYGEFVSKYVHNGANIIAIITNDGWWRNTPGHKQHNAYARLRAIENKKWVIRSANTGISSVINPFGKVVQALPYNVNGALKKNVVVHNTTTFYTQYPDLLYKIAVSMAVVLFAFYCYKMLR